MSRLRILLPFLGIEFSQQYIDISTLETAFIVLYLFFCYLS